MRKSPRSRFPFVFETRSIHSVKVSTFSSPRGRRKKRERERGGRSRNRWNRGLFEFRKRRERVEKSCIPLVGEDRRREGSRVTEETETKRGRRSGGERCRRIIKARSKRSGGGSSGSYFCAIYLMLPYRALTRTWNTWELLLLAFFPPALRCPWEKVFIR